MINIFALPTLETYSQVLGWSPQALLIIMSIMSGDFVAKHRSVLPYFTQIYQDHISSAHFTCYHHSQSCAQSFAMEYENFCRHPLYEETTISSTSPNTLWQSNILLENSPYLQMMFPAFSCFVNLQSPGQTTPRRVAWDNSLTYAVENPWFPVRTMSMFLPVAIHMEVS